MTDTELVAEIANGNLKALEELYQNTYTQLYAFILSITKSRQVAEDIAHDTYMRVFTKAESFRTGTNVKTWLFTIAKNLAYDHFRKADRVRPLFEDQQGEDGERGADAAEDAVESVMLVDALNKIPFTDAQIAVLYAVCGYKHREIAEILSLPEGTVRRRYRQAVSKLSEEMGGNADGYSKSTELKNQTGI